MQSWPVIYMIFGFTQGGGKRNYEAQNGQATDLEHGDAVPVIV